MEFIQDFAILQGTLLSLQKKVGLLKNVTIDDLSSKEKIQNVINAILKAFPPFETTGMTDVIKLHQVSLFLILNSDLKACEHLLEDANCGHLIDSAPTLSRHIIIDLFCKQMLRRQFHELLVYCPPLLCVELLDLTATKLKRELPTVDHPFVTLLVKAIYIKLLNLLVKRSDHNCEIDCVALKLMKYYTALLELLPSVIGVGGKNLNNLCLTEFGEIMISMLELVTSCLKMYIDPMVLSENVLDVYKMHLTFDYKEWHQESDDELFATMHEQLLSVLVVQIAHVTVDVWLGWAEIDSKSTFNSSLQKDVGEAMYKCNEMIESAQKKGMVSQLLDGLVSMLSSMAIKPRDEDDEIREADIGVVLKRVSDESFTQRKWLAALITKFSDDLFNEDCTDCIAKNIHLFDLEITSVFLDNIFLSIKNHKNMQAPEKVGSVFLQALNQLCLKEQIYLLKEFLDKYGINTYLCCSDYNSRITKALNTAVNSLDVSNDKKYIEFVNLSFQNPLDVIEKLIQHSVASEKQAQIMGDILLILHPLHSLQLKNKQYSCCVLVSILNEILQKRSDLEFSDQSFIYLIITLSNNYANFIDEFLKCILLPIIHKDLTLGNWSHIILWLETLQVFLDGTVKPKNSLHTPALLLTLAQILELSRRSLCFFSCAALTTCEYAINIIHLILESFITEVEDTMLDELCDSIKNLTSPINQFYFIDLWSRTENYSHFTVDWKVYLIHWIHMEKCNLEPPWGSCTGLKQKKIVSELAQLLPICVQSEWRTLSQNLHSLMSPTYCETSSTFVFECFIEAIQILALLSLSQSFTEKEQECAFSCVDFCIRNLSSLIKEEITNNPEPVSIKMFCIIFEKMVYLNCMLPKVVKESCEGVVLNLLVDLISCLVSDIQMFSSDEDEETFIKLQLDEALRSMVISVTMVEDQKTRQALARKLQEGFGVLSERNGVVK